MRLLVNQATKDLLNIEYNGLSDTIGLNLGINQSEWDDLKAKYEVIIALEKTPVQLTLGSKTKTLSFAEFEALFD